jgi:hypothetical protein
MLLMGSPEAQQAFFEQNEADLPEAVRKAFSRIITRVH